MQLDERPRIVVVGSANTDLVVTVPQLPAPGETVLGGDLRQVAGGKGANQAVAAARLGGNVAFIGRVGDDEYGRQTVQNLRADGIDTQHLRMTAGVPSGVALIAVHASTAENLIIVAPGANDLVTDEDLIASASAFVSAKALVVSLEIPSRAIEAAVRVGRMNGLKIILNPAPARDLSAELLSQIDIITPNERELEALGGVSRLLEAGVGAVVTTLGFRGARLQSATEDLMIPAPKVQAVDTVAAGDCFTGALAVEIARDSDLVQAARFATTAASLKVTRHGAQSGMPTHAEVVAAFP